MEKFQFKTTINCQNCIRSVTGFINEVENVEQWDVDISSPDRILTVTGTMKEEEVIEAVESAGFDIERV